ncbi:MAG: molybdopterin-dependent oxidoreductase [Halanaeroarchaeum sp.]
MTDAVEDSGDEALPDFVVVEGAETLRIDGGTVDDLPRESITTEIVCATGDRYEATWSGLAMDSLLDAVSAAADTTHVVLTSADGYRVAVPVRMALGGLLALRKDGVPLCRDHPYSNRFVAPDVEGARDVKGVRRIECHALAAGDDPDALEVVEPDDDRFAADRPHTQ